MDTLSWAAQPVPLLLSAGLLGLVVGSFLNVVILRLPPRLLHDWRTQGRELLGLDASAETAPPGLVWESSHCPQCKHALAPFDNIPLLSFALLGGRCRYCKAPISWQYPLIELLSGLASLAVAWKLGFGWPLAAGFLFTWTLIAAAAIDARTQLLPDQLTLPLLWLGLLLSLLPIFVSAENAIMGAAAGYLSLWSVYWLFKLTTGKEGMGYGDFKLLAALGAWMGAGSLLPILLLSSLIGAIVGGIALAARRQDRGTPIPFGPFIALAGWTWFLWGDQLFEIYMRIFQPGKLG